jgi:hypothetical protein
MPVKRGEALVPVRRRGIVVKDGDDNVTRWAHESAHAATGGAVARCYLPHFCCCCCCCCAAAAAAAADVLAETYGIVRILQYCSTVHCTAVHVPGMPSQCFFSPKMSSLPMPVSTVLGCIRIHVGPRSGPAIIWLVHASCYHQPPGSQAGPTVHPPVEPPFRNNHSDRPPCIECIQLYYSSRS